MRFISISIWGVLWPGKICRIFLFENGLNNVLIVNSACYVYMIFQFFVPQLSDIVFKNRGIQQEDVTCHTAHEILTALHESFPDWVTSHLDDWNFRFHMYEHFPVGFFKDRAYLN